MTGGSRSLFRDAVLRRYAAGDTREASLDDVSPRLLILLWNCTGLFGCGLLVIGALVATLLR